MKELIKLCFLLTVAAFCLFEFLLRHQSIIFQEFDVMLYAFQRMLVVCLAVWWSALFLLTFSERDLCMIGLLLAVTGAYFIAARHQTDAAIFLTGVTFARGMRTLLEKAKRKSEKLNFQIGLVTMLVFSSWWHLDMPGPYHGPRWMGLWNNPNDYGMLMGAGMALAIGLRTGMKKEECRMKKGQTIFLIIAAGMMFVGLLMSYSRGAWLGTGLGLLYLAWSYGKLKWRYVVIGAGFVTLGAICLWGSTADSAPWYVKRADLGRPSAQHRATAWRASLEIMRDHPLGVGWNNAVSIYAKDYSPPENGAAAITTNDYLMLGTELGIPALLCFVAYVGLCYRKSPRIRKSGVRSQELAATPSSQPFPPVWEKERGGNGEGEALRAACLAGALVLLVAFWFDGGLFKLPTAALFWVLLELGAHRAKGEGRMMNVEVKTV